MSAVHQATSKGRGKSARHDTKAVARFSALALPSTADPTPLIRRTCACGGGCPGCHVSGQEALLVESVIARRGQSLPGTERQFFESQFGEDLKGVEIHTDSLAAAAAKAVDARAFTVGRHIVFGQREYALQSRNGRGLLAHELAHVVQQSGVSKQSIQRRPLLVQRVVPAAAALATAAAIGRVAAKCIVGAITGALFDAAIQSALHAIRERTWRFWTATYNVCSIILSAILGCFAAPISAFVLEGWVSAQLGTRLGGMAGTLIGKVLLFIAKRLAIGIPKGIVGKLAKLGCVSPEQAGELGVSSEAR